MRLHDRVAGARLVAALAGRLWGVCAAQHRAVSHAVCVYVYVCVVRVVRVVLCCDSLLSVSSATVSAAPLRFSFGNT